MIIDRKGISCVEILHISLCELLILLGANLLIGMYTIIVIIMVCSFYKNRAPENHYLHLCTVHVRTSHVCAYYVYNMCVSVMMSSACIYMYCLLRVEIRSTVLYNIYQY